MSVELVHDFMGFFYNDLALSYFLGLFDDSHQFCITLRGLRFSSTAT
jgi:hypothetical protein